MKKLLIPVALLAAIVVAALFFSAPAVETPAAPVATTIFPVYDITRNIADGATSVELIVPPGASTHTFDPSPSTLRNLRNVEVVYAIGHGADDWIDEIINSVDAQKVVVDHDIDIRDAEHDEHEEEEGEHEDEGEEEHEHGPEDPHYWLSIPNAKVIAATIADDLSQRFPEDADVFATNLERYLQELDQADGEIRSQLADVSNPQLITLHDAWYYFAQEYGLEIVGTFEPTAGREPTPQYLVELQEAIEASGSRTLYSEPQLSTAGLSGFARDNNLTIAELDPIGGTEGRGSYIALMKYNAQTIFQNQ